MLKRTFQAEGHGLHAKILSGVMAELFKHVVTIVIPTEQAAVMRSSHDNNYTATVFSDNSWMYGCEVLSAYIIVCPAIVLSSNKPQWRVHNSS